MNQFQALWSKATEDEKAGEKKQESSDDETPATVKAADALSEEVFGHELTKSEKEVAGPAMHYAFGAATGGVYGAMAELVPNVTVGAGMPFATAVWFLADEVTVPLLGLSKSPTQYPLSKHAYSLASHFVYGLTTEVVRRAVRNAI
jgi:putative membrane protein